MPWIRLKAQKWPNLHAVVKSAANVAQCKEEKQDWEYWSIKDGCENTRRFLKWKSGDEEKANDQRDYPSCVLPWAFIPTRVWAWYVKAPPSDKKGEHGSPQQARHNPECVLAHDKVFRSNYALLSHIYSHHVANLEGVNRGWKFSTSDIPDLYQSVVILGCELGAVGREDDVMLVPASGGQYV